MVNKKELQEISKQLISASKMHKGQAQKIQQMLNDNGISVQDCDELNIYLNNQTGNLECLPGVLVPPAGYTTLLPEVPVTPKKFKFPFKLLLAGLALYLVTRK
ncbi:MAG: hypothetical protein CL662_00795 [Bacteroidetes bacterium]|nr:hypothetical protein [Bacteroidota bacterium]|tara:strand:+ start:417 stop:725 length:309 start_codon:yes stop_codon:yes gene_type:complete